MLQENHQGTRSIVYFNPLDFSHSSVGAGLHRDRRRGYYWGEGVVPVVTCEVLRKAERDPEKRPAIHVAG